MTFGHVMIRASAGTGKTYLAVAAAVHSVSMSEPIISMSWTSTSGQFSSSQIAIE